MSHSRQLAAIMFTDIVGYTALMGENEQRAFELLKKNRIIQKPIIEKFKGRWLKEIGDGVLASFSTVSDAVYCAKEIQETCLSEPDLKLRIGIHLGEVVFEGNDVFGDGVNIASRLENLSPAGTILVSESVHRNIRNKPDIQTKFIGEEQLKNVSEPVRIYQVRTNNQSMAIVNALAKLDSEKSIAVLPFVNMSSDPEQEYFCDGLSEELINVLAQLDRFKVAARTSSFSFKGQNRDVLEIGKKLNVNTILEGSVRKSGDRIRITVQLINVKDGFHLWSEKYDRRIIDIFDIQDEIALAILKELKVKLLSEEKSSLLRRSMDNAEAYQYFLQGRFYYNSNAEDGYQTAIKCFDKALNLEPSYARAYALRASCYFNLWLFILLPVEQSLPASEKSLMKALKLDNQIEEVHYQLARHKLWHDFDFDASEKEFQEVFKINPNLPEAISQYGLLQNFIGYHNRAITYAKRAKELDPFSALVDLEYVTSLYLADMFEEMLQESLKSIDQFPQFWGGYWLTGFYYWKYRQYHYAIDYFKKALTHFPGQMALSTLGCLYGVADQKNMAHQVLLEMEKLAKKVHVGSFGFAIIHAGLGDLDKAFSYFEMAGQERCGDLIFLDYHARDLIPGLNQDSRFKPFLKKVGIPLYKQLD